VNLAAINSCLFFAVFDRRFSREPIMLPSLTTCGVVVDSRSFEHVNQRAEHDAHKADSRRNAGGKTRAATCRHSPSVTAVFVEVTEPRGRYPTLV